MKDFLIATAVIACLPLIDLLFCAAARRLRRRLWLWRTRRSPLCKKCGARTIHVSNMCWFCRGMRAIGLLAD